MKINKFKLSPAGKLTVILSLILTPVTFSYASGIVATAPNVSGYSASESGIKNMMPEVKRNLGMATEIKITTPSEHGISHNHYTEFNVNEYGVIFNNATESVTKDGVVYNANQKLNGSPARVILNEVVGVNASVLAGHQDIIGMPADYILANANGISCQGCTFAPDFKNVTLAVGGVNNHGGDINISTADNANILSFSGGKENNYITDNTLILIAPVINSNDELSARSELNLIVGQNKVHLNKDTIPRVEKYNGGVRTIDGYYLGGMASGRIKIIDTRRENNINLFSGIYTANELDVRTEGTLRVKSLEDKILINNSGSVYLKGKNVDISQSLTDVDKKFIGGDAYTAPTVIQGEIVNIEADDNINISGGSIYSKNKTIAKANTINVNAHLIERVTAGSNTKKETPIGHKSSKRETKKLTATRALMSSSGETSFEAKEKITLKGVDVKSDEGIKLTSEGDIELNGDTERLTERHDVKYFHYGTDLRTGNDNEAKVTETFSPLIMKSNSDIKIKSSKDTNIHGANIVAQGQLSIEGEGSAEIGVANMLASEIKEMDYKQALGIAGSEKDNEDKYLYTAYKSQLTGKGIKINHNEKIGIFGSKINSLDNIDVIAKDGLRVDGVLDKSSYKRDQETGGVFDITISSDEANNKNEGFIDSELTSVGNLRLFSEQDLYIDGSRINAKGNLDIDAQGTVTVQAARQQQIIDEKKTRLNTEWFAKESSDKQYRAGFLINHQKDTENTLRDEHQIATLSAEQINITAGDDIKFFGTGISTSKGDVIIKTPKNVGFFTAKNRALINKNQVNNSGGFYFTSGMDKTGTGLQYTHVDKESYSDIENNLVVKTHIKGDLNINAGGDLNQQGTQHNVAKSYSVEALNINNMASNNLAFSKTDTLQVDVSIGNNIDHSGMTRPIEKSIKDPANTLDYIGGRGSQKGVSDPTIGLDVDVSGSRAKTSENDALALVTMIKAQDIKQVAKKDVLDEGTQYHATEGGMSLQGARHFSRAAVNSKASTTDKEKGEVSLRGGMTATQEIKGHLGVKAETSQGDSYAEEMLAGNINAKSGVSIKTTGDAYYYATNIEGGNGDITIDAGNNLYFDQVQDSQRSSNVKFSGNGKLSLGGSSGSKEFRLEGGGGYEQGRSQRTDAIVSKINTQGNVSLKAGADLTTKGMQIGNQGTRASDVSLLAAGEVKLLAAVSGSADINDGALADFRLGGKRATGGASKEGFVGAGVQADKVNQSVSDRQGGHIYSKNTVSIKSDSDSNQAIHLEGLKIDAPKVDLSAQQGGVFIESALSELPKDNWNFGFNLDMVLKNTSPKKEDGTIDKDKASESHYKGAGIKVMVDKQDMFKHQNAHINTAYFSLNTKKDAVMKGARIESTRADVNVGRD
ncbi:hemagglutinin repeat-containing protein [Yersinia pseudotuberculosis]|uniref:hemagglutinin repeat-containing protein n=1 Tax=Yersinia pseudotuberculosis TaxID=633 RepID=UPI00061C47A2|nr:hemagglutinin repeat-containing protein [Yersinia pseudotuberculosis]CNI57852.1 hemolysin HlyA [Yersinia pseudotuberculosis]CNJ00189.1 hemolysin HlyA [Yersinia pseudotuberculosis]